MIRLYINDNEYNFQVDDLEYGVSVNPQGATFNIDTKNKDIPQIWDVVKLFDDEIEGIMYTGYIQTINAIIEPNDEYNYIYTISTLSLLNILNNTYPNIYYPNDRVTNPTLVNILNDLLDLYKTRLKFEVDIQLTIPSFTFEIYNTGSLSLYSILSELAQYADAFMYISEDNTIVYKSKDEPTSTVLENEIYDVNLTQENQVYTNIELTKVPVPSNIIIGDDNDLEHNPPYVMKWTLEPNPDSTDPEAVIKVCEHIQDINLDCGYELISGKLTVKDKRGNIIWSNIEVPIKAESVTLNAVERGGSIEYEVTTKDRQQTSPFLLSKNNIIGNKNYTGPGFYEGYKLYFNVWVKREVKFNQTNTSLRNKLYNRTGLRQALTLSKSTSPQDLTKALTYIGQLSSNHETPDIYLEFTTRVNIGMSLLKPVMVNLPQRGINQETYYIQEINCNIFSANDLSIEYKYKLTNKRSIILGEEYFAKETSVRESEALQESFIYNDEQYYTEVYTVDYAWVNYVIDENNNPLGNLSSAIENYVCTY